MSDDALRFSTSLLVSENVKMITEFTTPFISGDRCT